MGKWIVRLAAIGALLSLTACKTLDEEECRAADWRTIGFEDGAVGYTSDRIGDHRKACAEYGIVPDLDAYQAGRLEGLVDYCVPANGFKVGANGDSYGGVCPTDVEEKFVEAYQTGQHLYSLKRRLANVISDLESKRNSLHRAESDLADRSVTAISSEATAEERIRAVSDVKELGERAGRLKAEIRQLEEERVQRERDLEDYRATLPFNP